jgi:dihydroxyacetone kinase-like predicted kinase
MAGSALRTPTSETLAAGEFLGAVRACATVLEQHADALDRLDVAYDWDAELLDGSSSDGDASDDRGPGPGTDLAATLAGACAAAGEGSDFSTVCRGLAEGAAASARTPAGHRLAGFLAGAGDALRNADRVDGARLALALEAGAERVTEADDGTHPGCLLAVMSAAADGALDASDGGGDLAEVLVSAAEAGLVELEQGPLVDARLSERGTVDAAAAGFLLVLDSLSAVVAGDPLPEPPRGGPEPASGSSTGHRYVVRCQVTPPTADIEAAADLEVVVHELSDRLAFEVVGGRWRVDAVTALPGAVVEALAAAGSLGELHIGLAPAP